MFISLQNLWTPLSLTPLFWLTLTLACFAVGKWLQSKAGNSPIVNPVLVSIILISVTLKLTHTPYSVYFSGAQFINFLLGPATVALAVPLAKNFTHIRKCYRELALALLVGSITSAAAGALFVWLLGGERAVGLSMATKAVTTPIAIALSEQVGGIPALTATLAIAGGIIAASVGQSLLQFFRIHDWRAHGFAAGIAGSGIAAAQVASRNGLAAAFAAIGIGLNGIMTAFVVPVIAAMWH